MKKINYFFAMAAMLPVAMGMTSCCSTDVFDPDFAYEATSKDYEAAFVAKYGPVSPNQSWDLTTPVYLDEDHATRGFTTRGEIIKTWEENDVVFNMVQYVQLTPKQKSEDQNYIINNLSSTPTTDWKSTYNGKLKAWVYFSHKLDNNVRPLNDQDYYHLGIHANGKNTNIFQAIAMENRWYAGTTASVAGMGYIIDTDAAEQADDNSYWYATATPSTTTDPSAQNQVVNTDMELKDFKVITVPRGAVYWCFDCNHDGDYSDMILLVEAVRIGKRYMIEDLGAVGDFDFNDIVVDVVEEAVVKGSDVVLETTAYIRAMGGTLDFTLKIGDTEWTKSEEGFVASQMYNTQGDVKYDKVLASFKVEGWDHSNNNISVLVKKENDNAGSRGVYSVRFPKDGTVPMIIAFDVIRNWSLERVSVPDDWFFTPVND